MTHEELLEAAAEDLEPLEVAILTLRWGYPLPVDLSAQLLASGYDVAALEAKYQP